MDQLISDVRDRGIIPNEHLLGQRIQMRPGPLGGALIGLRRRYTVRFARTKPADCPVHGPIVACDMSLECPGHVKIG